MVVEHTTFGGGGVLYLILSGCTSYQKRQERPAGAGEVERGTRRRAS